MSVTLTEKTGKKRKFEIVDSSQQALTTVIALVCSLNNIKNNVSEISCGGVRDAKWCKAVGLGLADLLKIGGESKTKVGPEQVELLKKAKAAIDGFGPLKTKTVPSDKYQALLEGLRALDNLWDTATDHIKVGSKTLDRLEMIRLVAWLASVSGGFRLNGERSHA